MMLFNYDSKKQMKECIGQELRYTETSFFGPEYRANGEFSGSNRPSMNRLVSQKAREFFATVTMKDGKIAKVS